jgi:tRNA (cytidine56-2'-O)-methyltransferase
MQRHNDVCVLRLGHRPGRDDRMTTHVGLTARALGADRAIISGDASSAVETVEDITRRFGGPFEIEQTDGFRAILSDFQGAIVHLTMYGERMQDVGSTIRARHTQVPLLVVVGAEKVPFDVYDAADFNVAVTNQPHSEVAGLAVFLDRLFEGAELDRQWEAADRAIVPKATGKKVIEQPTEEPDAEKR